MMLNHSVIIVFLLNILQSQISISLDANIREVPLFGIANSSMGGAGMAGGFASGRGGCTIGSLGLQLFSYQ